MKSNINMFAVDKFLTEIDMTLGTFTDPRLALLDNVFGEDDNSPVPSKAELYSRGGPSHNYVRPSYNVGPIMEIDETLPMGHQLNALEENLSILWAQGAELSQERSAYADSDESLAEWQSGLDAIKADMAIIEGWIAHIRSEVIIVNFDCDDRPDGRTCTHCGGTFNDPMVEVCSSCMDDIING